MADYLGNDRTNNFDDILGPLPSNKTLFRNKNFILTCTIPIKVPITAMASHSNGTNGFHIVRVRSVFFFLHFQSLCPIVSLEFQTNGHTNGNGNGYDADMVSKKHNRFSTVPFVKEHLRSQIETGGGKVYNHFEDIPKNKYKQCILIAAHPCTTAKYVQCLAADISVSCLWLL